MQVILQFLFANSLNLALTFAGALAAITGWILSYYNQDAMDRLAAWLKGEIPEENWSVSYLGLFRTAFGPDHFSWRCALASIMASSLGVVFMTLLLKAGGMFTYRAQPLTEFWLVLPSAIFINYVADYFSLWETRQMLGLLQRFGRWWQQIVLLAVDLMLSSAIILLVLWAYFRVLPFYKGQPETLPEIIGAFSLFSVFFYSTFVTCVWSWVYWIATLMMRSHRILPVKWLDIDQKPGKFLISYVFVAAFASSGVVLMGIQHSPFKVSYFETLLCRGFNGPVCERVSRQVSDENRGRTLRDDPEFKLLVRTCDDRSFYECAEVYPYLYQRARTVLSRLCPAGDAESCTNLGDFYRTGSGVAADPARAAELYHQGCEGGNAAGCTNLGFLYWAGSGVAADTARAAELYRQGCEGGSAMGCTNLGYLHETGAGVAQDLGRAAELYRQGCAGGDAGGCTNLGYLHETGAGVAQDLGRAAELYLQGCAGGDAGGCTYLGALHETGAGVARDPGRAAELFRQGCEGGNVQGCTNLGVLHQTGAGVARDPGRAAELYRQGCEGGNARGCTNLGRNYRDGIGLPVDWAQALVYLRRGCEMGHWQGCDLAAGLAGE